MATTFVIRPDQVPDVIRKTAAKVRGAIGRGLRSAAERARTTLKAASPVYTGQFRNTWEVIKLDGETGYEVVNTAPHAGIIELGARPHGVSPAGMEALRRWVRLKIPIIPIGKGPRAGKLRRARTGEGEKEIEEIVQAIAHRLRVEGQKGLYLVRDRMENLTQFAMEEVAAEVAKAMEEE